MGLIVDPSTQPLPMTANLWDKNYKPVTSLTLPEMDWPNHIRWRGRVFAIYFETNLLATPDEFLQRRKQGYREVEVWDAP